MVSINRTTLIGRVGKKPKITLFENSDKIAQFSLATSISRKLTDGKHEEETEWHNIMVYGKQVDFVEKYIDKGDLLFIEGRNRTRRYLKDDMEFPVHEIVVSGYESGIRIISKYQPKATPEKHE